MVRVGEHGHYLFADILLRIGKINAVVERLAHLCLAVNARKAQTGFVVGKKNVGLDQCFSVNGIKFPYNFPGLLYHGKLVLSHGNGGRHKCGDIRGLADRIGKKAYRNACLKVPHLNFGFHSGVSLQP